MFDAYTKRGVCTRKWFIHPPCHSNPACLFCFCPNSPKKINLICRSLWHFLYSWLFALWSFEELVLLSVACWDHFCLSLFEIVRCFCMSNSKHRRQKSITTHFSNANFLLFFFYEGADDACCSVSNLFEGKMVRAVLWQDATDGSVWVGWGFWMSVLSFVWFSWWSFASWNFGQNESIEEEL